MSDNREPAQSDLRASLAIGKKRRRNILIALGAAVVVAAVAIATVVVVNTNNSSNQATADTKSASTTTETEPISVKIASSGESIFQDEIKTVAAEKGLDIEWVIFDQDWVLPNTALAAGEVDANAFQHIAYLSQFNVENDADLTPVLSTVITQWGIFSATVDSLDKIKEGDSIAIPDDASNGGRALFILQDAGLLTLKADVGTYPTVDDIAENPLDLNLVPIAATTIKNQYDDPSIDAVVVGTSYFDPTQNITTDDALFLDDSLAEASLPYVNVIATRDDNKDNPAWAILAEVYKDPRVEAANQEESFGNTKLVDVSIDDLRTKLGELEDLARSLK